jgi:hypothetical protein
VPLAQVWTHYPFPSKIIFCTLIGFPMTNYSKFNISHILSLKNFKSLSLNPTHWRLSTISRVHQNFPIIIFWFNDFLIKNLFIIQWLLHCISTHYETNSVHPYLSKVFQQYQKHNKRHHGFGKSEYDKQNKTNYTNYMYRLKLWQFCWTNLHTLCTLTLVR